MPPAKKQKTSEASSAPTQEAESSSATPHKGDSDSPKLRDSRTIPLYEYICMHRPHFDYEVEIRIAGGDLDDVHEKYQKQLEEDSKKGIVLEPAKDHPDWKWTIAWEGFKTCLDYRRRANYCDPDRFSMYIYNDFNGYGLQELMENIIVSFDGALKKKDDDALNRTWALISGLSLWLNETDMGPFIGNEDGERVQALTGLMGYALLRGLAAIDKASQLKPDSDFPDLPIVISSFLEWSKDLPDYGIEGDAVSWRPHAAAYFKKGKFDANKGVTSTAKLLEELEEEGEVNEGELPNASTKDPWGWAKRLKEYKREHGPKIGGTNYDITLMSRKERAKHAFKGVDPLKDVSEKDLKEGNLDFA
ncbi:hypothetical protein P153DRAFT_395323 [Dothidotthia symphoricarpi CBS 119687]|uniref:SAP domain-containing protein n=1 Tax=Dothidotthia symphoricarpi CBS 119687 TaxID=1392245 RepID=A0A6A6AKF4_9PLEO|nr:uncharacterized protein P153DRAFT_395323 [Dothidotthia symphoricarpi CBS 119687]KAF2130921.1 hypothetical protein P153DRAFT_395323 [Dothidotthia symphoricarpi CBS 119687]